MHEKVIYIIKSKLFEWVLLLVSIFLKKNELS